MLRSRVKPSRLDPRPRLACTPLQTQRRPVALPRRLLTQAASLGVVARLNHPKKSLRNFLGAPVIGAVLTPFALAKIV